MTQRPSSQRRLRSRRREDIERDNLFAMSLDLMGVCGFDGRFQIINPAVERILGYTPEEVMARPFLDFVLEEDRERTLQTFTAQMSGAHVLVFENRWRRKDGTTCWLQWNAVARIPEQVIYAVARDITEQREAQAALATMASIVESSNDAIIGLSLHGVIESWNAAAEEIFGYRAAEVRDKPMALLIPPGHADHLPQLLDQIRRGQRVMHYETVRRRKDGTVINVSLTVSPVRDAAGRIASASVIARDVTERKLAERERMNLLQRLEHELNRTRRMTGLLHVCSVCNRIRDESGYWSDVVRYVEDHSEARLVPGRCPDHPLVDEG
jgi:PAS domain S-box-containing protein